MARKTHVQARHGRRRRRLVVIEGDQVLQRLWTPRKGLPGPTTASCPPMDEVCRHVLCSQHLAFIAAEDRPGRRFGGTEHREPTLRPLWLLEGSETCFRRLLARAEVEEWTVEQRAAAFGLSVSGLRYLENKALAKLRAAGIELRKLLEPDVAPWQSGRHGTAAGTP